MIVQAITTRFFPASNVRGSRVKATAIAGSMTLQWEHGLGIEPNHAAAARALAEKFGWHGNWHGGGLPDGHSFVWVAASEAPAFQTIAQKPRFSTRWEHNDYDREQRGEKPLGPLTQEKAS